MIELMEVSPRDGLQNEAVQVSTEAKLALITGALAAGVKRIEVTSFVHPKKVPQLADAEALCAALGPQEGVSLTGLVMNLRGAERALATGVIDDIGMVLPVTDAFAERNQGMSVAAACDEALRVFECAAAAGRSYQLTLAVAFGCPFAGRTPLEACLALAERFADVGLREMALADTIGVAAPGEVTQAFRGLAGVMGVKTPLRAHFHNTRGLGIANALAARAAGVATLDASIGGIGGCPFAPGATGNIATEELLYALERDAAPLPIDLAIVLQTAGALEVALGKPLPSLLYRAGLAPSGEGMGASSMLAQAP